MIPTLTDVVDPRAPTGVNLSHLSARERQILDLLAQGHRIMDIAAQLCRSPKTVETHKARIKEKLKVKTSVEWMTLLRALPGATA